MPQSAPPLCPSPRAREDARLFERYCRDRDPATREALITRFLPLARHLAQRYPHAGEREDVVQVASLGLLKAIDRYDPGRGIAFSSYAVPTITGELKRYFRDLGWTVRVPRDVQELALRIQRLDAPLANELGRPPTVQELAERCQASVEEVLEARETATAHHPVSLDQPAHRDNDEDILDGLAAEEPGFERAEDATAFDQLLAALLPRERAILRLRFADELLQREIAERMGISQMQVSRILNKSLDQLRAIHPSPHDKPS